ncbi:MAG: TIGR01212 family radical SAM protein [Victivallales bacterium]|jgi:radical SAM protein (TIGR01212 family)|nr:TIGR01212 family radical SAM protein [Victivallales bacterium]
MNKLHFFSDYIADKYNGKLHRIGIDLSLGCPNRLNRFGPGCVFCAEDGNRARHLSRNLNLPGQVASGIEFVRTRYGAKPPYIAYFQAFTSTYAPVEKLRELYKEVLDAAPFALVIVGTRPDALPPETVEFLAELAERYEVWVELGVQSTHDSTLNLIRRGHDFATVEEAVRRLDSAGIAVGCHLIAGLPGEDRKMFIDSARKVAGLPFRAVKLHPLLTLKGTVISSQEFTPKPIGLNEYEYADYLDGFLRELPDHWLIMRLTAEAEKEKIITPRWWMSKGQFLDFFKARFNVGATGKEFSGVVTQDGSPTLYHPEFRQHFHSLAGAATEAEQKYVAPSRLRERLSYGKTVRLLDVGFGLGVNCAAALSCGGACEIVTLENDPRTLHAALSLYPQNSLQYRLIDALDREGVFREGNCRVRLLKGDARCSVTLLEMQSFDVIFQDGFSPDYNPELWSFDFVRALARLLKPDGVLVSFCSALPFRGALLRTGLAVGESPPCGRKRGGTVAGFDPAVLPLPLPPKELGIILHSTAGVAYRDPGLADNRDKLFLRRNAIVAKLRRRGVPKWYKP